MKNIPRIFVGNDVAAGIKIPAPRDAAHYLTRVMRGREFLAFGGGNEFYATISDDGKMFFIGDKTNHGDVMRDITLYFAPIKKTDELLNMATQMGVSRFIPVITEHTVAKNINWERMHRIVIEASEQSNRNTVPEISDTIQFGDLDHANIVFADERASRGRDLPQRMQSNNILVGPEGGLSDAEFMTLDKCGAHGISLGHNILRAELAAVIAIDRICNE